MIKTQFLSTQSHRENLWVAFIFAIAAYLVLFNLSYAPLWHDEAPLAVAAKNITLKGEYTGWDGRNLFISFDGRAVDSKFRMVSFPPWQALPSALGILIFGENETGVRLIHGLLGLLSLIVFWFLLRLDFSKQPRLRLLAFTLFALSAQTILFMRQGRYAADAFLFTLLCFYAYRLYINPGGKLLHLLIAGVMAVMGFLNHFAIGAAFGLSLGAWHLLFYRQQTTRRQWIEIILTTVGVGLLCLIYLISVGILLSDEKLEHLNVIYKWDWFKRHAYLIYYIFRDLLKFSWLPLWIVIWFGYFIVMHFYQLKNDHSKKKKQRFNTDNSNLQKNQAIFRWAVLLALFLFFSGLIAVRRVAIHPYADMRHLIPALAFSMVIIAACIDWLWHYRSWGKWLAPIVLMTALTTNALSYPFVNGNVFTKDVIRFTLPNLIREIHHTYPSYVSEAVSFLRQHAKQDDTIFVDPWQDFAVFQFYLSDQLIFCCALNDNSALPKEKIRQLGLPLYKGDVNPKWHVVIGYGKPNKNLYDLVYIGKNYGYPTHRPELEFHLFEPLPARGHLRIYHLKN